jgi:lysophospholipase L1-like esterase
LQHERILVLGDSITYAGGYVDELDLYLRTHFPARRIELLDLGIPSETVTGLTEPEHPFPRPDVHERLDRTLRMLREANWTPDLVLVCYGMNDGIYRPLDGERFAKYRDGIARLVKRAGTNGVAVTVLTPPPFDPRPAIAAGKARTDGADGLGSYTGPYVGYDRVLARYGDWLLSQQESAGWDVIDLHEPLRAAENGRAASRPVICARRRRHSPWPLRSLADRPAGPSPLALRSGRRLSPAGHTAAPLTHRREPPLNGPIDRPGRGRPLRGRAEADRPPSQAAQRRLAHPHRAQTAGDGEGAAG